MAKTELVISDVWVPQIEGRQYQNPNFFDGPRDGVKTVLLFGNWPEIAAAYKDAGVDVQQDPVETKANDPEPEKLSAEQRSAVPIPDQLDTIPWSGDNGLRRLAMNFSDGSPVTSKDQAVKLIEAERDRRSAD
jgi:hypothetical protein